MYLSIGKRLLDLFLTVIVLTVFSLVMLLIVCCLQLRQRSPILFRQTRLGLHHKPFTVLKFRTMTDARDAQGNLLPDADRLTTLGQFLRRTSLDELPTLINVLRGEMSLVGPRPLLMQYLDLYTPEQKRRHNVKPGITGWAQINGRNAISWEERFALDIWYVDHQSLRLDMKILLLTIWKVVGREGISQQGHATMPEFMGSKQPIEDPE